VYKIDHKDEKRKHAHKHSFNDNDIGSYVNSSSQNSSFSELTFNNNCAISNHIKHFLLTSDYEENSVVHMYSMDTGLKTIELCGHTDKISSAVFCPKDKLLITGSEDTTAIIWDLSTGDILFKLLEHNLAVNCAIFDKSGNFA